MRQQRYDGMPRIRGPRVRGSGPAGLTLFEMVIATAILALMTLGVLAAMNGSFLADRAASNATSSQAVARRVMEECAAVHYNDLMSLDGDSTTVDGYTAVVSVVQASVDTRLIEVQVSKAGEAGAQTRLLLLRSAR